MSDTYYITTPIYFPSNKFHIGQCYTTVAADTLARYKKMRGFDVKLLTGTDDHGQKIERAAAENGTTPMAYVDGIVENVRALWRVMDIDYDIFIRTTDEYHEKAVQQIFRRLYDQGDIYKSAYEGWYCTPCETFFTERQLVNSNCPDCGRPAHTVREECYFFRLSKYQERITKHLEDNPGFIMPLSRRNEMINNFLKPGLEDLCVSRASFTWGVPVDFDPGHVVYVWVDALSNYITALGYGSPNDAPLQRYWPANVHLMAKEIVRFHAIIWPAMLMALELPLPKLVFGHGWITLDGRKMSKSQGAVVDPLVLAARYGSDAVRYFVLREFAFGQDGAFSNETMITRINADLANDLGNLLSRTVGMVLKYFGGALPAEQAASPLDSEIAALAKDTALSVEARMDAFAFHEALNDIWVFVRRVNKYIDETEPWVLAKNMERAGEKALLANVLYVLAESLRVIAVLISPFMPKTPAVIRERLGIAGDGAQTWESAKSFGLLPREVAVTKGEAVFPRIDAKAELAELCGEGAAGDVL